MSQREIDKVYQPKTVEERWYTFWLAKGIFHAKDESSTPPFSIVIPPPNITGSLHVGHALNNTLQDILVRWKRMSGFNTLWLPGTDHAGIATQNVIERQLITEGSSRDRLGREEFIKRVWKWREKSGRTIIGQLKRLGASCDWERERFTMDEGLSAAVREVFVRLYEEGLIYRGERLINWCPRCGTALSDIEVEHEDVRGKMYYIKYPLADDPETFLTVATTRPETMLGDTAVAVHPEDFRYNKLIGKKVLLPLTNRRIPVVGDAILVDREFGTGAVKITPGHDFNDEKAGQRHGLSAISILNEKGQIQPFLDQEGVDKDVLNDIRLLDVPKARSRIEFWLGERGYLLKVEDHKHAIGRCYRCKTVVEPYRSPQWFVKVNDPKNSLAAPAIEAVRNDRIRMIPEGWKNNYFGWMENIQDWCISRQIWWGHQIPAWYCKKCNADELGGVEYSKALPQKPLTDQQGKQDIQTEQKETWQWVSPKAIPIVSREKPDHCPQCRSKEFVQDPDVLDTWFSSALWPFSTLGWPENTKALKTFYPTSVLVTSFDILFFWVARMIMMGLKFMGEVPFKDVYIHALVRDAEGQKMSKSKGNVIDPLEIMEKHGTDALRFTLASMASPGRDIKLSEERIEGYRNFANKIWNAARFLLMNCPDGAKNYAGVPLPDPANLSLADRWILSQLQRVIASVNQQLEDYRFDEASRELYQFLWHAFCDWYLELIKPTLYGTDTAAADRTRIVAIHVFETVLRLLHPFMPFITEELWQAIPHTGDSIAVAPYPIKNAALIDASIDHNFEDIQRIVSEVRNIRSVHEIPLSLKVAAFVRVSDDESIRLLEQKQLLQLITWHSKLSDLTINPIENPVHAALGTIVLSGGHSIDIFVVLPANTEDIAKTRAKEISQKEKRLTELSAQMEQDEKKLSNPDFLAKAHPDILKKTKARHEEHRMEYDKLFGELQRLREMAGGTV
jgi:valyl-tRNA synthetase